MNFNQDRGKQGGLGDWYVAIVEKSAEINLISSVEKQTAQVFWVETYTSKVQKSMLQMQCYVYIFTDS